MFFLVLALNSANPGDLKNRLGIYLNSNSNIGGELTEIVSAPKPEEPPKESSFIQSALGVLVANAGNGSGIFEDSEFDNPLVTGEDSLLQNQNPITVPTVEPRSGGASRPAPYYGPRLDDYFIFPTVGFNHGKLHPYNAVDISRGDDCLYENIPVFAATSGIAETYPTQSAARWANSGYGNYITLLGPNGITTLSAHLKNILVEAGQYVNQGAIIAYMGGYPGMVGAGNSTGCHLHFGVRGAAQPFAR